MVCLSCSTPTKGWLCPPCARTLRPAPDQILLGGLRLVAAFQHEGPARVLLHHLKYRGITQVAEMAAERIAARLPRLPLVPVPRAMSRRLKYGVDPARVIAAAVARRMDVPVVDALWPPIHSMRRAGGDHSRPVRPFRPKRGLRFDVIVVDDVVTTGATAMVATDALGIGRVRSVASASVATHMSSAALMTIPNPGVDKLGQRSDRR